MVVIPATGGIERIREGLMNFETVVRLKVKPVYADFIELLHQMGREHSTLFVERIGSSRQKV